VGKGGRCQGVCLPLVQQIPATLHWNLYERWEIIEIVPPPSSPSRASFLKRDELQLQARTVGYFEDEEAAAQAYDCALLEARGPEQARQLGLNFPEKLLGGSAKVDSLGREIYCKYPRSFVGTLQPQFRLIGRGVLRWCSSFGWSPIMYNSLFGFAQRKSPGPHMNGQIKSSTVLFFLI